MIVGVVVVVGVGVGVDVGGKRGGGGGRSGTTFPARWRDNRFPLSEALCVLGYKKLDVYKCAIELLAVTAGVLERWQQSKGNAVIADQLKRACLSIPLNIGEGAGKATRPDQTKHYVIARGSAMECGAIFDAALVLKLVDSATAERAEELIVRIVGMLTKMCHFAD